jgi:hypothetical protein
MKNLLIKIAIILLTVVLTITIIIDTYIFVIAFKLSESVGWFDKLHVVAQYKLFQHAWLGTFSLMMTLILLVLMLWFVIKEFLIKIKRVYYLKQVIDYFKD